MWSIANNCFLKKIYDIPRTLREGPKTPTQKKSEATNERGLKIIFRFPQANLAFVPEWLMKTSHGNHLVIWLPKSRHSRFVVKCRFLMFHSDVGNTTTSSSSHSPQVKLFITPPPLCSLWNMRRLLWKPNTDCLLLVVNMPFWDHDHLYLFPSCARNLTLSSGWIFFIAF